MKLDRAIAGAKLGGVGPGVSPKTALSVGLKVDVDAIPAPVAAALKAGKVNLDDPVNGQRHGRSSRSISGFRSMS